MGLLYFPYYIIVGRDSVVGIATQNELGGSGIESRWGDDTFFTSPDRLWETHLVSSTMGPWSFPGRGVNHPLPSYVEVKERVGLHL
jgi:hypothetical protein